MRIYSSSIQSHTWGKPIERIINASLDAVDPERAVHDHLLLNESVLAIDDTRIDLDSINRIFLVGAGKAGEPMAQALLDVLGNRQMKGLIIVKDGYANLDSLTCEIPIGRAGHPIPDERGVRAAMEIIKLLQGSGADDLVICLISGGGSALMTSPVPGISLGDLQVLTDLLLASGANINEINTLRKHLDAIKGGQIARLAAPSRVISLILSDVVGDPLDVIASGPTVPDPSTYRDAFTVLERYSLLTVVPDSITVHLRRGMKGEIDETPKPGDPLFDRVYNHVIANNRTAALAAKRQAQLEGFNSFVLTNYIQGEANQAGRFLAAVIKQIVLLDEPLPRPCCIIIGGETTVTLEGNGLGGRNQELALAAVNELAGLPDVILATLATDGGDGPTDAAGAVVTGKTFDRAIELGLSPQEFLKRNDSYHFFQHLDDLIITGPTRTNVNDLTFLFAFPTKQSYDI